MTCLYSFYLGVVDNKRLREGGGGDGMTLVWPSSLINDWFVLVRLFHSSCKLDSMQILGWMLLGLKHNDDARWCMFARCARTEREPERKKGKGNEGAVESGRYCTSLLMWSRESAREYRILHRRNEKKDVETFTPLITVWAMHTLAHSLYALHAAFQLVFSSWGRTGGKKPHSSLSSRSLILSGSPSLCRW